MLKITVPLGKKVRKKSIAFHFPSKYVNNEIVIETNAKTNKHMFVG